MKLALLTGLFLLLIIVILFFRVAFGDIPDRIEAMKVPKYPNVNAWRVSDSRGFPDGTPHANIYFSTNDKPDEVISFYRKTLQKKGWSLENGGSLVSPNEGEIGDQYISFKKGTVFLSLSSSYYEKFGYEQGNYRINIDRENRF